LVTRPGEARPAIERLCNPESVAVVGTSPAGGRGASVHRNLLRPEYKGRLYAVNPKYDEVLGTPCFPNLSALPEPVDCAIVALPAGPAMRVVEEAAARGVGGAVLFASGFAEIPGEGTALQERLASVARAAEMAICGPNCFGLMSLGSGTLSFSGGVPSRLVRGPVAIISQSGGVSLESSAALMERGAGVSHVVSCGNEAATTLEDYADYLVDLPEVHVLGLVVEAFRQPDRFADVARRAAALGKPIVLLRLGRWPAGVEAARAHTGADAVGQSIDAATLGGRGIAQVRSIDEFIETLALFAGRRWPRRDGVVFVSASGGRASLLADLAADAHLPLAEYAATTRQELRALLPAFATVNNPLDLTGAAYDQEGIYAAALAALLRDRQVGLLAVYQSARSVRDGGDRGERDTSMADLLAGAARAADTPVVAYTTAAGAMDAEVLTALRAGGVPLLQGAENTVRAIRHAMDYAAFARRRD
jgi:acyl-CoA synthetase (NDP forming)